MSRVFVAMAMSLDGFITGPNDDAENPAGINGMRLMDWLSTGDASDDAGGGTDQDGRGGVEEWRPPDPVDRIMFEEAMATGAVITGRRTGDFAGYWGGDHHNGVQIFAPPMSHPPPTRTNEFMTSLTESPSVSGGRRLRSVTETSCCTAPTPLKKL